MSFLRIAGGTWAEKKRNDEVKSDMLDSRSPPDIWVHLVAGHRGLPLQSEELGWRKRIRSYSTHVVVTGREVDVVGAEKGRLGRIVRNTSLKE